MCLLLIDGLGLEQLEADSKQALFLTTMATNLRPITDISPATTVASFGSLGTGRPRGEHGLVGTTVAVPGQTRAMNLLRWSASGHGPATDLRDRIAPERFQPEPTVFERAAADRVSVNCVGPRDHARSGLTRAVLRGGRSTRASSRLGSWPPWRCATSSARRRDLGVRLPSRPGPHRPRPRRLE